VLTEWRRIPELTERRDRFALNLARNAYPRSPGAAKLRAPGRDDGPGHRREAAQGGQLVIVDEASLAGTFALDELVGAARQAVRRSCSSEMELNSARWRRAVPSRFLSKTVVISSPSSATSGALARSGRRPRASSCASATKAVIEDYEAHGRITEGSREVLLDAIYTAWKKDVDSGKSSLMIAGDSTTVTSSTPGREPTGC